MDNILKFAPIYKERVWGGRSLEKLYKRTLPSDDLNYGESWEIVDRPNDQSRVLGGKFDGETLNISAINEYQALLNWTQTGWGEGDLSIDLDLDVNAPLGLDPLGTDTDEEITIDVYIVMFKPNISQIE